MFDCVCGCCCDVAGWVGFLVSFLVGVVGVGWLVGFAVLIVLFWLVGGVLFIVLVDWVSDLVGLLLCCLACCGFCRFPVMWVLLVVCWCVVCCLVADVSVVFNSVGMPLFDSCWVVWFYIL